MAVWPIIQHQFIKLVVYFYTNPGILLSRHKSLNLLFINFKGNDSSFGYVQHLKWKN